MRKKQKIAGGKHMKKSLTLSLQAVGIVISSYIYAVALNYLYVPNKIISGGITGIAMLISHITNVPIGVLIILFNIPIFILGYKQLGKRFIFLSIIFVASSSLFIDLTANFRTDIHDLLLAAIYGGVVTGASVGLTFRLGGSSAGVDIIAAILNRKYSLSIGEVFLAINFLIILVSIFIYPINYALYTLIAMFVSSKAMDIAQVGLMSRKTILIISDKAEEISDRLLHDLHRGVTYLAGEGGFTHTSKKVIMCVVTRIELSQTKDIVFQVDPFAFLTISDTKEVVGKGFTTTKR